MATGDQSDFAARLLRVMPGGWFPTVAPVLTAILQAPAYALSVVFGDLTFAQAQQRVSTAQGAWLDIASQDFFGSDLPRLEYEQDPAFAARIKFNLTAPRGTRAGLAAMLTQLTGTEPTIFEPARPGDTGGWGTMMNPAVGGGAGWGSNISSGFNGTTERWGSLLLPYQFFVTVQFPQTGFLAFANQAGFGTGSNAEAGGGSGWGSLISSGFNTGNLAWIDPDDVAGAITQAFIYQQIAAWIPVGTIAWTYIN
jgi:hypothetical protein